MVFPTVSDSEPSAATNPMASSIKSHPLHNFSFPGPRWSSVPLAFGRQPADSTHRAIDDLPPLPAGWEERDRGHPPANGRSSKILLRLPKKEKPSEPPAEARAPATPAEPGELTPKVWNLRRRKPSTNKSSTAMGGSEGAWGMDQIRSPEGFEEEVRRVKVSVPLRREEAEADFLAMTGGRPSRRLKKRPRKEQRALDNCFPGLRLTNITPGLYKVAEDSPKKVRT